MPSLVDKSDDDVTQTPSWDSEVETNTDIDCNNDIEFCELCHKPAWLHKYCFNKNNHLCQQMFCMFVKNRKKIQWLTEPVPSMTLYHVPEKMETFPDVDWCSFDYDISNAAHIEREFGRYAASTH